MNDFNTRYCKRAAFIFLFIYCIGQNIIAQDELVQRTIIEGNISPKSIAHNGKGLFFAQNMFYNHSVTVYDRDYNLIKTIGDKINPKDFGIDSLGDELKGSPVEVCFSESGKYAWVTNYRMFGKGFTRSARDTCKKELGCDRSFIYKINTETFVVEAIVETGCVPKFTACSDVQQRVLVSNWCSGNISIIDSKENKVLKEVAVGAYPRGIAIDDSRQCAYVSMMGTLDLAVIDLKKYSVSYIRNVGPSPRHLCLDPAGKYLYASINSKHKVVKIDLEKKVVSDEISTGKFPRSMVLDRAGKYLYVVNYKSNAFCKIDTENMEEIQEIKTPDLPIGITYDDERNEIWVACYTGTIAIYGKALDSYVIVLASYLEYNDSQREIKRLKKKGVKAYSIVRDGKHRVVFGDFKDKKVLMEALEEARRRYAEGAWVMKK